MFTANRIALSDLAGPLGLDLRRDARIGHVGKVPTRLDARLVPCGKQIHLHEAARAPGIAAYVVPEDLADAVPAEAGLVVAERPVFEAMRIHEHLAGLPGFLWADFDSEVDPSATVMPGAFVAPKNVRIGPRSVVLPQAVILERSIIGADCLVGAGSVIGMEAFEQFVGASPKRILKQAGGVLIGDWVSIEAKTTISRSTFGGFTRIGRETKVDAQVYLAHDCQVGDRVTICSCCSINGRVEIGDDAYLGPNCTVSNGLLIGAGATVSLGATVTRNVPDGTRVSGTFALAHEHWLRLIRDYR